MSGPALSRRERLILRDIERDLLDDEEFVLRMSDLMRAVPPAGEHPVDERTAAEPPPVGTLPDQTVPDRAPPPAGHPRERPPRRTRLRRTRPPGASPHGDAPPRARSRRTRFREAVRDHGLLLLVPVCAALAAVTFGGAPVYFAAVFAVVLVATVAVGASRYRHRRRRRS
ncbi:hypothetical protein [Streptodolium elevatio]|uniref:DUF1707 domain-containing protein n=1 Tax=Streptodolium elevatio TaxID=3157996 RepID=A0ABV3DWS7_9ACTN